MVGRLFHWFIKWQVHRERLRLPEMHWQPLLEEIQPDIGGYPVYLETRSGSLVPLAPLPSGSAMGDVVGLVVACIQEDVPPWDGEKPARHLAAALSARNGLDALPFISRDLSIFVGWYVRVRPKGK